MLKPVIAALAVATLAACVAINVSEAPSALPPGGSETCDAAQYGYLVGQEESAIDRSRLPKSFRVICAECMVTQDYRPERLNIHLGTDQKVGSVRCG